MKLVRHATAAACLGLLAASARASNTLQVPRDFPTIQSAIAAAQPEDTVLVGPGTWHETLNLLGKHVMVVSTDGAGATILDAGGAAVAVTLGNEQPNALLEGFTIRNAVIGVQSSKSRAVLAGCIIRDCSGAAAVSVSGTAWPTLQDCVVTANAGTGVRTSYAGFPGGEMLVSGCTVSLNGAGGVAGRYIDVVNCTVEDNVGLGVELLQDGSLMGSVLSGNTGSGARTTNSVIFGCTFVGNGAWGFEATGFGVGLANCRFLGNASGGARLDTFFDLFNGNSWNTAEGCTFANGDGLWSRPLNTFGKGITQALHCTFDGGAGISALGGKLEIRNSILRGTGYALAGSSNLAITYSDIEGGAPGVGNLDADPLWVNPVANDYRLQPGSPCINVADPFSALDPDGSPGDLGAVPYDAWTDLGGALAGTAGAATLEGTGSLVAGTPVSLSLQDAPASTGVLLVVGAAELGTPFKGGTLWPTTDLIAAIATDASGEVVLGASWPVGLPAGTSVWVQVWWSDGAGPEGFASSNGVRGAQP